MIDDFRDRKIRRETSEKKHNRNTSNNSATGCRTLRDGNDSDGKISTVGQSVRSASDSASQATVIGRMGGIGTFSGIQGIKTVPESNAGVSKINSTESLVENGFTREKIDQLTLNKQNERDLKKLAEMIILGSVSEEQFFGLNLSEKEVVEVFKNIRDQRDWKMDDEYLAVAINKILKQRDKKENEFVASTRWDCNQRVEKGSGSTGTTYPYAHVPAVGNECGEDPDDRVLKYYTSWGPSTNPDNVKYWSNYWHIRNFVWFCHLRGLSASGLCTTQTRVCTGSCIAQMGNDIMWVYLHK